MNQTSRAPFSNRTGDPSHLTPLEIALSRCSWCPTATPEESDEHEELAVTFESYDEPLTSGDELFVSDLRTTQAPEHAPAEAAAETSIGHGVGYVPAEAV